MILLPLRFRMLVLVSIALIIWISYLIYKDSKPMTEYSNISGTITYIAETYQDLPNRHIGKYRYITIDSYPSVIELFIGKDKGDFKPKYEKVDSLKLEDLITIYGDNLTENQYVNRRIFFITKNDQLYFEKGGTNPFLSIGMILLSISISVFGYILLKKNKIKY